MAEIHVLPGITHDKAPSWTQDGARLWCSSPVAITARAGGEVERGVFEGYAWRFGVPLADGRTWSVARGAFDQSLKAAWPVLLWSHRISEPIGRWTEAGEDEHGLRVRGELNLDTARGREALSLLRNGDISGLSIGGSARVEDLTKDDDGNVVMEKFDLWEVSIVSIPANPAARVFPLRSAAEVTTAREFERFLRASGFSFNASRKLASGGWKEIKPGDRYDLSDNYDPDALAAFAQRIRAATRQLEAH